MNPAEFVETVRSLEFPDTFNPYLHRCSVYDHDDAPSRRTDALLGILEAAARSEVDSLWIGRDLGYRGGRRTGLALTDDVHLLVHAERWGASIRRPTRGEPVGERTAAVIWSVLGQIDAGIFLWNVFPLHPHKPRDPFTNRAHKQHERRAGEALLLEIILLLKPRRLVCIGNDAASSAQRIHADQEISRIRHPSYGGQKDFLRQIYELYGRPPRTPQHPLPLTRDGHCLS